MKRLLVILALMGLTFSSQAQDGIIGGQPQLITSTTALFATGTRVRLVGFYVSSTSSGTLVLRTGGASGTAISGTITPAVGWHFFPAEVGDGLHVTVANTISVTFITK